MYHMIKIHACPRQTDRRTNIMAIALRFVLTNALRAENGPENVLPLNAVRRDAVANLKTV